MPAPDQNSPLGVAIRAAVKANELGGGNPYALSFAGLGRSGPSYGVFQHDMAVNSAARNGMWRVLVAAGVQGRRGQDLVSWLSRACDKNPLGPADAELVDNALSADGGRAIVDQMDAQRLDVILGYVGTAGDAAAKAGRALEDGASLAVALWSNMTGEPSSLAEWLADASNELGPSVTLEDLKGYLKRQKFFAEHQRNLDHFLASVAEGVKLLPAA